MIQIGTLVATILLRSAGYPDPAVDWPWLPVPNSVQSRQEKAW